MVLRFVNGTCSLDTAARSTLPQRYLFVSNEVVGGRFYLDSANKPASRASAHVKDLFSSGNIDSSSPKYPEEISPAGTNLRSRHIYITFLLYSQFHVDHDTVRVDIQ